MPETATMLRPYGEVLDEMDHEAKYQPAAAERQQLVARIKRGSKYAHQAPEGGWFDVRKINRGYPQVVGNNNAYDRSDVTFGIRLDDGTVVELK